jgi:hypothetical protein
MKDFDNAPCDEYKEAVTVLQGQIADLIQSIPLTDEQVDKFVSTELWNFLSLHKPA